jgi:pilus assembly protein CpaB
MALLKRLRSGASLLLLATVLGVATGIALFSLLSAQRAQTSAGGADMRSVVVARQEVPAGAPISESFLEVRRVAAKDVLPGAATDTKVVAGRLTRYPLAAGEQVLETRLVPKDTPKGSGLAFSVPTGMRAVSVAIDEVNGAGGLTVPGDHVDVLVGSPYTALFPPTTPRPADGSTNVNAVVVTTLLQDVLVLAVGQEATAPLDAGGDSVSGRRDDIQAQPKARSVTLAVTPQQAQSLFLATQQGRVGLALRSFGDQGGQTLNPALAIEPGVPQRTSQTTSR